MKEKFDKLVDVIIQFSGSLTASVLAFAIVIGWLLGGIYFGYGTDYQMWINSLTTILTFLIAFLIQHSQNKDTKAIHIKLNALVDAAEKAENKYIGIENQTEEELLAALKELEMKKL